MISRCINRYYHHNVGARNWGATNFVQADGNGTFEVELKLKTVDQVIGPKKVSLMKVDCEGCEWAAIKGYDFVYPQFITLSLILILVFSPLIFLAQRDR